MSVVLLLPLLLLELLLLLLPVLEDLAGQICISHQPAALCSGISKPAGSMHRITTMCHTSCAVAHLSMLEVEAEQRYRYAQETIRPQVSATHVHRQQCKLGK
jgi:hypothetical protein